MGPEMAAVFMPLGFFAMVVAVVVGRPMVQALAKRVENESKRAPIPTEVMSRLERMEQSIDSIAVEVERISEGQRFTTRLLSEVRDSAPALPERSSSTRGSASQ
ncbi:MAG: hypothetical protein ABIR58_07195 [Gemmatimonadaceae bacterium]